MQIAVLGAGGFIGRHLVRRLVANGARVTALDVAPALEDAADALTGADARPADLMAAPPALDPGTEVVVNLAQSPHYRAWPRRAGHLFGVNVAGALHAAEAAHDVGARALLHASSGTVYAPSFAPLREDEATLQRGGGYALSKLAGEEALGLLAADDGFAPTLCCLRPFGVFGPGQTGMLVPAILGRVAAGQAVTLEARADAPDTPLAEETGLRLSLTDVDDASRWIEALAARGVAGEPLPATLNLAGAEPIGLRRLAETLGDALGRAPVLERAPRERPGDFVADRTRLESLVDATSRPFADSIRDVVAAATPAAPATPSA